MGLYISVIMAVYNGKKYIRDQLESILRQTVTIDELIIIDDCSSEPCVDIIEEYKRRSKTKISYIEHKKNEGYAQTFFEALRYAKGKYIFFADQDDVWMYDKVKVSLDIMENHPKITCLSSLNIIIDGDGKELKREKRKRKKLYKVSYDELVKGKIIRPGMSIVINASLKQQIDSIDTSVFEAHDRLVEYVSVTEHGFYWLQDYLTYYRIHGANVSGMNLSKRKLRTDKNGRMRQIEFEIRYLDQIDKMDNSHHEVIAKRKKFFLKRKELLKRGNVIQYMISSFDILNMYFSPKVWAGDILSIIKEKKSE